MYEPGQPSKPVKPVLAGQVTMVQTPLAASMLSSEKTARHLAGEIWLQCVSLGLLDQQAMGHTLGRLLEKDFGPLKRAGDVITQQLFRVSDRHDRQLQLLLENIFSQLPATPVKNLKILLEIYTEVLAVNQSSGAHQAVLEKLAAWRQTTGLQRTIASLEKQFIR